MRPHPGSLGSQATVNNPRSTHDDYRNRFDQRLHLSMFRNERVCGDEPAMRLRAGVRLRASLHLRRRVLALLQLREIADPAGVGPAPAGPSPLLLAHLCDPWSDDAQV